MKGDRMMNESGEQSPSDINIVGTKKTTDEFG